MQTAARITLWIVRLTGMILVILGVAIWTHRVPSIVPLHMAIGLTFVIALWMLAGLSARLGVRIALVTTTALWGLLILGFGMGQRYLLLGAKHWLVESAHLFVGIAGMALALKLGAQIRQPGIGAGEARAVPNDPSRRFAPTPEGIHAADSAR